MSDHTDQRPEPATPLAEAIIGIASSTPNAIAVVDRDRSLSYSELADAALSLAGRLVAFGLEPGERVAAYSNNSAEYLVTALGTWLAGGVFATVYPQFGASELEYALTNASPRILIVEPELRATATAAIDATGATCELCEFERHRVDGLPDAPPLARPVVVDESEPALITYTSGSTARPKPVTHSYGGIARGSRAYADVWHLSPEDRTLVCLPMAWLFGLTTAAMTTLLSGGTVVVLPKYNPLAVVNALVQERVTFFPGVTTMFTKLTRFLEDRQGKDEISSLRLCGSGGEPRNEPAFARWRELTGCPVHDVYCASECWPVITYDPIAEPEPVPGSAGIVVPGASMRVVDESGADVQPGATGAALWRAPSMMLGYWNEPELTAAAFTPDGWYRSGDFVRVEDGHVFVMGRGSDMIIRGGSNVSPVEVELVLARHTDIEEAAVVGIPDPEYGEQVAAAIVIAPGGRFDPEEFKQFCATQLARYKIPSVFREFEALPHGATGKVARKEIRPLLAGGEDG